MNDHQAEAARIAKIARYLFGMGLSIFPIHHPWAPPLPWVPDWDSDKHSGKRPAVRWTRFQTERPTDAEIREWFESGGLFNIGLPTGEVNGFNVIDADSEEALEWMLEKLPPTPMRVVTSASYRQHWLYATDPLRPVRNTARLEASGRLAVDVRGTGGYVLAPGSRHRSGAVYARVEGTEQWTPKLLSSLTTLPDDLQLAADKPPAVPYVDRQFFGGDHDKLKRAEAWMAKRDAAVAGQGGDAWTFVTAANLTRDFDLPDHMAWSLLCEWNQRCQPPWGERELTEKFKNAQRYGKSQQGAKLDDPLYALAPRFEAKDPPATPTAPSVPGVPDLGTTVPDLGTLDWIDADGLVSMDKVQRQPLDFLIFPWILRREITLFAGFGGDGKSFGAAAIAAATTGGPQIPGMAVETTGKVLFFSAEDDVDTILQPRLSFAGCDMSMIKAFPMHEHGFIFDEHHFARLDGYLAAHRPVLLVIDPIVSFLPAGVDMAQANHVRAVLDRLRQVARKHDVAVLVIAHLSKSGDVYGSVDFKNRARSVLKVYKDPENSDRMFIAHEKGNYAQKAFAMGYQLIQLDPDDRLSCKLHWVTPKRRWTADELHAAQAMGFDTAAIEEVETFLITELSGGKAIPVGDVNRAARSIGIDAKLLGLGRRRMGVLLAKEFTAGGEEWVLRMPIEGGTTEEMPL